MKPYSMRMSGKAFRIFYQYHKTKRLVSLMASSCVFGISSQSDHVPELSLLKQSVSRPANLFQGHLISGPRDKSWHATA